MMPGPCPTCGATRPCGCRRPTDYELSRIVDAALGALHPRNAEEPRAALRELVERLRSARDTFEDQGDEIDRLRKSVAA